MCARFEFMILNGMCSSDPKGFFTFVFPHANSIIDYFIVSADFLRTNIDMCKEAGIIIYLWRSNRSLESYCVNYQLVGGAKCASSLLVDLV